MASSPSPSPSDSSQRIPSNPSILSSPQPPSSLSQPSFHAQGQQFMFTCSACKKIGQIDTEKPIQESALLAFNSSFHVSAPSAVDLLSESFVVLPPSKLASAFQPPTATTQQSAGSAATKGVGPVGGKATSLTNIDHFVESASKVLDIVTAQCPVSSPLCTHCSGTVMGELDRRIQEMERDREEYSKCLRGFQSQAAVAASTDPQTRTQEEKAADEEEAELIKQEMQLEAQLQSLRREKQALNLEYDSLESESLKLSEYESQFWKEYEEYSINLQQVTEEQAHVKQQIKNANDQLERMKRTNVFDDAFHISHDGHFPTINGFRLGRLPSQPVEWAETSAALGQVLLLLHTMARHTNYKFTKYRLMPMGSYSKMSKLDDPTTYELYGSNDLILGRLFWYRRFDTALVWLLACIQEFGEYAQTFDPKFQLKYPSVTQHTQCDLHPQRSNW